MNSKGSPTRRASLGAVAVAVMMLMSASPALADNGTGAFTGYEIPPSSTTFTNMNTLCASFNATATDPLIHELDMTGTFHAAIGTGDATFTRTTTYYANPEGTYSDRDCLSPAAVSGTMTIDFGIYHCVDDSASYERRGSSVYTLEFSGTCDNTTTPGVETVSTNVTFAGDQVLCPPEDCSGDPNAASEMFGAYVQTH